jgi:two-component system osmolarity sensor histidine kinase EnvZ
MLTGDGAEEAREGLVRDIEDMDAIIGQFLDLVREGTGEALEPVDLDALVEETAQRYARLGHAVSAHTGGLPLQRLRPTAMRRLLANLVDNALVHGAGAGGVAAEVTLQTWSQAGANYLSVLDRGPGIPTHEVERLKQPFTRLDPDRAGEGGTGLGLAIAQRIAHSHGSELELLMRPGGGLEARMALLAAE